MRTLIVGTGHSGTKWITETLNDHGIVAEHQTIRHAHTLGEKFRWPAGVEVIVSFEAVPIMGQIEARRLLVVRHPDDTIGSWLKRGAFGPNMRSEFAMWAAVLDRWFPTVLTEGSPQDQAAHYWYAWNLYALTRADCYTRLDRIAETDWFDVKWVSPIVSPYPMSEVRPRLQHAVNRLWEMF